MNALFCGEPNALRLSLDKYSCMATVIQTKIPEHLARPVWCMESALMTDVEIT